MDVAVDIVMLSVVSSTVPSATAGRGELSVLLVRRGLEPFLGRWALPGGFVRPGEDLAGAAARELAEETGLTSPAAHLEQLASYGAPDRDPRGRVVTVAYLALLPIEAAPQAPRAGGDAAAAGWQPVATAGSLAFDHDAILADGVERARAKLEYTPLATAFCRPEFTVSELRLVYEAVWGVPLDPRNFHRKVTGADGFLAPTGRIVEGGHGRPAQLFRAGTARLLHPPMLRP